MLAGLGTLIRALASLGFLGLIAGGSWFGYQYFHRHDLELRESRELLEEQEEALAAKDDAIRERDVQLEVKVQELEARLAEIQELEVDVAEKTKEIAALDTALRYIKVDTRRAHIVVVGQEEGEDGENSKTTFRFVEVDAAGKPIAMARDFTIEGDVLYVDSWVVKFDDELVEQGDPLRSTSVCLLRRVFGEFQAPAEGFELDVPNERPEVYGGQKMSEFETDLWSKFWEYATDPEMAAKFGIRAAHGEAPSQKLKRGYVYKLTLRASGGLTLKPEKLPAGLH